MASGCVARLSRATASGRAGSATGDSDRRAGKAVADLAFLCPDGQRSVGVWIEERELFSSQSSSTPSEIRSSLVVAALVGPTEVHGTRLETAINSLDAYVEAASGYPQNQRFAQLAPRACDI